MHHGGQLPGDSVLPSTGSAYSSTPPKTVHGLVPKTFFPKALQEHIGAFLRPGGKSS